MEIKFTRRFLWHILLWILLSAFVCYGTYFACTNTISVDDRPMTALERGALIAAFATVSLNWVALLLSSLVAYVKRTALTLDVRGICDTYIYVNLFCLVFFLRVRRIPWDAVKEIENSSQSTLKLILDHRKVETSPLARLLIRFGYTFPTTWTDVRRDEIYRTVNKYIAK